MVQKKNLAREMAYAQFGTKRFVGLQDVAIDLNRLTEPGLWAIIGTFEDLGYYLNLKKNLKIQLIIKELGME